MRYQRHCLRHCDPPPMSTRARRNYVYLYLRLLTLAFGLKSRANDCLGVALSRSILPDSITPVAVKWSMKWMKECVEKYYVLRVSRRPRARANVRMHLSCIICHALVLWDLPICSTTSNFCADELKIELTGDKPQGPQKGACFFFYAPTAIKNKFRACMNDW